MSSRFFACAQNDSGSINVQMKVLLVQPPIQDFYRTRFREYPLGLLYLASALERGGHDVGLLDARYSKRPRRISTPVEFSYLSDYYTPANDLFLGYCHYGLAYDELARRVSEIGPDAVLLSSMFTPYVGEVIETARAIKEVLSGVKIFAGGHHATADPDSLAATGLIDCVVRGEGEEIVCELIESTSPPAIFSAGERPCRVSELDSLPHPSRHLLSAQDHLYEKRRYTMLLTSRGCPHDCSFCSVHMLSGHRHRRRSVEGVVAEIERCIKDHDIRVFDIQDDNFLFDREHARKILEAVVRLGRKDILFMASNGLNVAHLDTELLHLMRLSGFKKLDLALGTGGVASREMLKRPESVGKYEDVLNAALEEGLPVTTYIILGLPYQPIKEMRATVDYLNGKKTLISPSVFYNVPGMPLFDEASKFEYRSEHRFRRSSAFNNLGIDFTRDDIFALFKDIRQYNLSRPVFC